VITVGLTVVRAHEIADRQTIGCCTTFPGSTT